MINCYKIINSLVILLILFPLNGTGQNTAIDSISVFHESTSLNTGKVQREMIYLHLDNTSYYRGDRIFFACYLVTAGKLKPSDLSQTVYVELLNPSGKIIDRCVLKATDGRCHGSLSVDETPFYSGFYEIRAYTRYMLNFGEDAIYSRVIPVYNQPKKDGDWAERSMLEYGSHERTFSRPKPKKTKEIEAKLYPEGGRLVSGLPARVALEVTDANRRPVQATGRIVDAKADTTVAHFSTGHMGRGDFSFVPRGEKYRAIFDVDGKSHSVELPKVEREGVTLAVNNQDNADSVKIEISRTAGFPTTVVGASLTCRGELCGRAILDLTEEPTSGFAMARKRLPTGVIQLTLFDAVGNVLADRLFFNDRHDGIDVEVRFDRQIYGPHEPVELDVKLSKPVPFSISVTDADGQTAYGSNIMADLLLASEIKGYVHNPAYYFDEPGDPERRRELDQLLMVQGWRRYPWQQLAGLEPYIIDAMPEKGIEVHGKVLGRTGNKPQSDVNISVLINNSAKDSADRKTLFLDHLETDENGEFAFRADVSGDCVLTLSTSKKGKVKPYRIIVDVNQRPGIRGYDIAELCAEVDTVASTLLVAMTDTSSIEDIVPEELLKPDKYLLETVEVKGKSQENSRDRLIEHATVSYEISDAQNGLIDNGGKPMRTLIDMLAELDKNFTFGNRILYNGKDPLFIIEDEEYAIIDLKNAIRAAKEATRSTAPKYDRFDMLDMTDLTITDGFGNRSRERRHESKKFNPDGSERTEKERKETDKSEKDSEREERMQRDAEFASVEEQPLGNFNPRILPIESIEKVYINNDYASMLKYIEQLSPPDITQNDILEFQHSLGCLVLVELNSSLSLKKGMRRMTLDGYTVPVEYYSPDYSDATPYEADYRRTLYWNPDVRPDATGNAKLRFYNNSTARRYNVSAESVTGVGIVRNR